jgi:hypothetical protein
LICLSAGFGYVLTRSVGLPGDRGDLGNWLEPLGVTALISEAVVVVLAASALSYLVAAIRPDEALVAAVRHEFAGVHRHGDGVARRR